MNGPDDLEILGYSFADILRAQQGGRLSRVIDTSKPSTSDVSPERLAQDVELLTKHGIGGLQALGYDGVLDRLSRSGLITK